MAPLGRLAQNLSAAEADVLSAAMLSKTVPANATLISAGAFNDTLFLVQEGEFHVALPFEKGPLFVGTRPPGSWVGEVTFLEPGPASATVTAAQDSVVLGLSAATLASLTLTHPALVAHLVRALSEDLAHRVRTAGVVLDEAPARAAPGFFKGVFGRLFGAEGR